VNASPEAAAPPVVAPPPGHPRFPLLDSLRAVAAIGVLLNHAAFVSGAGPAHWWGAATSNGNLGIAVFFVLSGFLLYRPFVHAQLNGAPSTRLRDFARRRLLRIVPAYWLALTVLAIWPGLSPDFAHDWWRYFFFLQVYDPYTVLGGIAQAWTLCVEIAFYLALPFVAVALGRLARNWDARTRVRRELVLLAAVAAASIALRYVSVENGSTVANTLPAMLYWFALGMGLALVSAAIQGGWRLPQPLRVLAERPALCWAGAAVAFAAVCLLFPNRTGFGYTAAGDTFAHHLLGGAAALLLVLPAVLGDARPSWPRRLLALPTLAWLGLVSYGIYLWQQLAPTLHDHGVGDRPTTAAFVALLSATFAVSVACAALSYYAVERPILRFKR
jgi:peptidoglycan/LPS O-acetylase OafA/YrhL